VSRSVNLDFFAADLDQKAIMDFLFASTDVRVFESYSLPGAALREFKSTAEVCRAYELGVVRTGGGTVVLLQLWSPSVMAELAITRFSLDPGACEGHKFRFRIDGGGLIQLYFGGVCDRVITRSHFGHQSKSRVQAWGQDLGVDWNALSRLSGRIQRHIRNHLAAAKTQSCPILCKAFERARSGFELKLSTQTPWAYALPPDVADA